MAREQATPSHFNIFTFLFSFLAGVFVSSVIFIPPLAAVFLILIAAGVLLGERVWKGAIDHKIILLALILTSFGLGSLRYAIKDFHRLNVPSDTGVAVSEPEKRDNFTRFVLRSENGEKVLVSTDLYSLVEYGDRVRVAGKLERPGMIDDGSGRPFDYAQYLSKDDIYYTIGFAKVEIVARGEGNRIKAALLKIKQGFVGKIREILSEPESSLLAGLIVAGKDAMPKDLLEEFRRAGVIHIVVLSGYNLTIIADFLRKVFGRLSFKAGAYASIAGVLLFVVMTGAEATVVRASIMVMAAIGGKLLGRHYSAPRALLVAAFAMVLHNPKILVFDPSFQLSFLATLALIYVSPVVEKYLGKIPEKFGLRGVIATTIATQVTVLPLLVYSMGEFSLVSLLSNVLILLVIPYTMLAGFLAALSAFISTTLALPLTYISHLLLAWVLGVSHVLGNLPFATIKIADFSFWFVLVSYLLLAALLRKLRRGRP